MGTDMQSLLAAENWAGVADIFNGLKLVQHLGVRVCLDDPYEPRCILDEVEPFHLGGIGQDFINGAMTSAVIDLAIGLTAMPYAGEGYFATRNLNIDLTSPIPSDGFYVLAKCNQRIGKQLYSEATVFSPQGDALVYATGVVRLSVRARAESRQK